MRRIVLILLTAAVVLVIAWGIAALPGRVSAELGSLTIEAATPVAILALLLLFALAYLILRALGALLRLPAATGRWRGGRHRRLGDIAVTRTLVALAAGERADARREAGRARRLLGNTPQTLLLAAEAERLAGRDDAAAIAFRALAERRDAAFLGLRGLLRQAMAREDWSEAMALARQAEAAHPGAAWLRQQRALLAVRTGQWSEALELADGEPARAALAVAAADIEPDTGRALKLARQAWKEDAGLPQAALAYAARLRADGREARAQAVIRHSWTLTPHPDLATFALAPVNDKLARAQAAQRLTEANPTHTESRLLLARTALDAGLSGEARHQAEAARDAGLNQRRLWLLLAEIEERDHAGSDAGRAAQATLLRRAAAADSDPTWQCTVCHTPQSSWHPACPACASAGSLRWLSTARAGNFQVPALVP